MTSTRGTKPLVLPQYIYDGLAGIGYLQVEAETGVKSWRHPKFRNLFVTMVRSNMPGSAEVIAEWFDQPATRIDVDSLLDVLHRQRDAIVSTRRV